MLTLFLFIFLPIMEIAGFVIIGAKIGFLLSLLWVIASFFGGFYFLTTMGTKTYRHAKSSVESDIYPLEEMFDAVCILIGSLLLILPGFISDFLAVFFLVPAIRHGIFLGLKASHESVLEEFSKGADKFSYFYSETTTPSSKTVIEGEFKVVDEEENKKISGNS